MNSQWCEGCSSCPDIRTSSPSFGWTVMVEIDVKKKGSCAFLGKGIQALVCGRKSETIELKRNEKSKAKEEDLLSFSLLMRQGQKERSAHAQSPRPIPFQEDRGLATPFFEPKKWVEKHCILCYPAWPNASKCRASLGLNKNRVKRGRKFAPWSRGRRKTTAATPEPPWFATLVCPLRSLLEAVMH